MFFMSPRPYTKCCPILNANSLNAHSIFTNEVGDSQAYSVSGISGSPFRSFEKSPSLWEGGRPGQILAEPSDSHAQPRVESTEIDCPGGSGFFSLAGRSSHHGTGPTQSPISGNEYPDSSQLLGIE